jgi:hypothetical protein
LIHHGVKFCVSLKQKEDDKLVPDDLLEGVKVLVNPSNFASEGL